MPRPPALTLLPKLAVSGAALFGFVLVRDRFRHYQDQAGVEISSMLKHDYLDHTIGVMGDYSGNETMTHIKDTLTNPSHLHFIQRPWIRIKGVFHALLDSAIPLTLMGIGLPLAFGKSPLTLMASAGSGIGKGVRWCLPGIGTFGGALWDGLKNTTRAVLDHASPVKHPGQVLSLGALAALGVYFAEKLTGELNGDNQDAWVNYLGDGGD